MLCQSNEQHCGFPDRVLLQNKVINKVTNISIYVPSSFSQME